MSVRKRTWTTRKASKRNSWIVDYIDQGGDRHIQTFGRKKDADDDHATVKVDVSKGVHTPHSKSRTVAEAAEDWLQYVELESANAQPSITIATTLRTTSTRALAARRWRS